MVGCKARTERVSGSFCNVVTINFGNAMRNPTCNGVIHLKWVRVDYQVGIDVDFLWHISKCLEMSCDVMPQKKV